MELKLADAGYPSSMCAILIGLDVQFPSMFVVSPFCLHNNAAHCSMS